MLPWKLLFLQVLMLCCTITCHFHLLIFPALPLPKYCREKNYSVMQNLVKVLSFVSIGNHFYGNQGGWAAKSYSQSQVSRDQNWGWRLKLGTGDTFERLNAWISNWMIFHFTDTLTDVPDSLESNPLNISINTKIFHYGQYIYNEYMNY